MTQKRIFYPSFVPVGIGILVALILAYAARASVFGYSILVWDGLFTDFMPIYLPIIAGLAFINIVYVSWFAKNKYDTVGTIFCNIGGLLIAVLTCMSWYAF
ncbi:MAG: hypothetical protein AAB783_02170 [Patescibacteria group bacterium]